jgi:hypothetical protein
VTRTRIDRPKLNNAQEEHKMDIGIGGPEETMITHEPTAKEPTGNGRTTTYVEAAQQRHCMSIV